MNTTKEMICTEHPELTIGQLCDEIRRPSGPVKRSTHAGNQPPRELALAVHFPAGLEILAVDTITGADSYTVPCDIRLDNVLMPLCERKHAKSRVAGALVVTNAQLESCEVGLVCMPKVGEHALDFHMRALAELSPNNMPVGMTTLFAEHAELYRATMEAAIGHEDNHARLASGSCSIGMVTDPQLTESGVFGCSDESPPDCGVMPSLNVMMAVDILLSHQRGADQTLHLGAGDMVRYTRDQRRMREVGTIARRASAALGLGLTSHCYKVPDIRGLDEIFPTATHASQHQLLRAGGMVKVDISQFRDRPCGRSEGELL
jgi:hypothetical protein